MPQICTFAKMIVVNLQTINTKYTGIIRIHAQVQWFNYRHKTKLLCGHNDIILGTMEIIFQDLLPYLILRP
jgi:hypothetical protein